MTYVPYTEGSKKESLMEKVNFKKQKIVFDDNKIFMNEETPIRFLVRHEFQMIIGGYWDGKLLIQNFTKKQEIAKKKHLYRITMIEVSESEEIIITGTEKGDIVKWILKDNNMIYDKPFFHHQNSVTGA